MKNIRPKNGLSRAGVLAAFAAACGMLVLLGCQNPLDSRGAPEAEGGMGALALTVNRHGAGRTIMPILPDEDDASFYLQFDSLTPGNESFSRSWHREALIELLAGDWRLRITMYLPDGAVRREIARSDWVEITVAPGVIVEHNLALAPIGEGDGRFIWYISFSADVTAAQMRVVRIDGGAPSFDESFVLVGPGATGQTSRELPAGLYRVIFTLSGSNGASAEISKLMHIHQNLESRFVDEERLFADFIFPAELLRTILNAWNGTEWDFDLGGGRRITAGHFGLLPVNGVDNDNFGDIAYWFNRITTAANAPASKAGLEALIDAALLNIAAADAAFTRANNLWTAASAQEAIVDAVANIALEDNHFDWTGPYAVTVTIGAYEVDIAFVPVPVTGVEIQGLPTQLLEETYHLDLSARVVPLDARYHKITWQIPVEAHRDFVEVQYDETAGTARVTGLAAGTAVVYAVSAANPDQRNSVTIEVFALGAGIVIEGIEILNDAITLEAGESEALYVEVTPANTTQPGFSYASSNTDAATVGWEGGRLWVRGVSPGTAIVTVTSTANPGLFDTVQVTVIATPTGVELDPAAANVPRNRPRQFSHTVLGPTGVSPAVTWTVEPESAGTIENGLLRLAQSVVIGDPVIVRATAYGHPGAFGTATVTVIDPEPDYIVIAQGTEINVERGTPQTFTAAVKPEGSPQDVTWSIVTPIPAGAMISADGVLATASPLSYGDTFTVRVAAVGHPGVYAHIIVTVDVTPAGVVITSPTPPVAIVRGGAPRVFTAEVSPPGASQNVAWSVSPQPAGVSISADGELTIAETADVAFNAELVVTATIPGTSIDDTMTVTVTVPPTGVTITSPGSSVSVDRGATQAFAATVYPTGASQDVVWEVSGSGSFVGNVLTVYGGALPGSELIVTARALGSYPAVYATNPVTVTVTTPAPTGVLIRPPTAVSMERGQNHDFVAQVLPYPTALQEVAWSVSPVPAGVSITQGGSQVGQLEIAGDADVSDGQTLTVTATVAGHTSTATVTIVVSPTGVTIDPHTDTMIRGDSSTQTFTATVHPAGTVQNVAWSVSPEPVGVSITAAGVLTVGGTAVAEGAILTVTARIPGTQPALTSTAAVTVRVPPTGITITPQTPTMIRGGSPQTFAVAVTPTGASQDIAWDDVPNGSFVGNVLRIYSGAPLGDLTVTARTQCPNPPVYGTATVTVVSPAPASVTVTPNNAVMVRGGEPRVFTAVVAPQPGIDNRVVWSIVPPNAATITGSTDLTATVEVTSANSAASAFEVKAAAAGHPAVSGAAAVTVQESGDFEISLPDFIPDTETGIVIDLPGPISLLGLVDNPVTIRVSNHGIFDNIRWMFEGNVITDEDVAGRSFVYNDGANLNLRPRIGERLLGVGPHFLTVEFTYNGQQRSSRINFTVIP